MKNCGSCGQVVESFGYREAPARVEEKKKVEVKPRKEWKMLSWVLDTLLVGFIYLFIGTLAMAVMAGAFWVVFPGVANIGGFVGVHVLGWEPNSSQMIDPAPRWFVGFGAILVPTITILIGRYIFEKFI